MNVSTLQAVHTAISVLLDTIDDPGARSRLTQLVSDLQPLCTDDATLRYAVRQGLAGHLGPDLRNPNVDRIIDLAIADGCVDGLPPRYREMAIERAGRQVLRLEPQE